MLTNDPAVPKKRPAKARPAGEPVTESTAAFTNLPNSLARAADAGKNKDLRVLIPLALFSVFAVAGLALLRRRSARTAAAQQTREAPRHYVAAPSLQGAAR